MADSQANRGRTLAWLVGLMLIAGTLAVYWPVRHYDYVNYDDRVYTYENPIVARGLTWAGLQVGVDERGRRQLASARLAVAHAGLPAFRADGGWTSSH